MNIFHNISIRNLAWFYSGFFSVTLALMFYLFYSDQQGHFFDENRHLLTKLSVSYQGIYRLGGASGLTEIIHGDATVDSSPIWYQVQDSEGGDLFGNFNLDHLVKREDLNFDFDIGLLSGIQREGVYIMYMSSELFDGRRLIVGQDITDRLSKFSFIHWLRWLIISALVLGAVGGFSSGYFILHRLELINNTSKNIIETRDLNQRIPVSGAGKDFAVLAQNLNAMLEKIQDLMMSVRQVSDNIAHDLRTPLTRLRLKLDVLESDAIQGAERVEIVESLKRDADNLLNVFSAILRITNIESGERHAMFENVRIDKMLHDLLELYEPIASEKNQNIVLKVTPQTLSVDGDLLFQALANVLDNAVKYTQNGGEITLSLYRADGRLKIAIADSGIGVDSSEMSKLFRRFYRVEQSRNMPGNGLGLSLVAAVVDYHKGEIQLLDNQPGLRVVLAFPG